MSFITWAIQHPPLMPLLFGALLLLGFAPTFYYLIKMIYSPYKYFQGGDKDQSKGAKGQC